MLTSDPTSDSSDTGSSGKDNCVHVHCSAEYKVSGAEGNSGKPVIYLLFVFCSFIKMVLPPFCTKIDLFPLVDAVSVNDV
jgi:hypothetical protein